MKLPTWMPSANVDAQCAHLFVGWWAILFGVRVDLGTFMSALILLAWIGVKEYGFDLLIEKDSAASSSIDAAFYILGGLLGLVTIYLTR